MTSPYSRLQADQKQGDEFANGVDPRGPLLNTTIPVRRYSPTQGMSDQQPPRANTPACRMARKTASSAEDLPTIEEQRLSKARRQLWVAAGLCFLFMCGELIGGYFANSLSLMTDAAHLLSDLAGFMISLFALWLGSFEPTSRLSYGFHRAEILGALFSVFLIWGLTGVLLYEAVQRILEPTEVKGKLMFFLALGGLAVNLLMGYVLHQSGHGHSHGLPNTAALTMPAPRKRASTGSPSASQPLTASEHGHAHGLSSPVAADLPAPARAGHAHAHGPGGSCGDDSDEDMPMLMGDAADADVEHGNCADHGHSHGASSHGHSHSGAGSPSHAHGHTPTAGGGSNGVIASLTPVARKPSRPRTQGHGHSHNDHGHSHGGHGHENINVKAAFIHVLGDTIQSVGVMIAAGLIWYNPDWHIADPICTFLFSILVLFTTFRLIKQSIGVLMEGVPEGIDPEQISDEFLGIAGVVGAHDLHIWSLSVGKPALSVHLLTEDNAVNVLRQAMEICHQHNIAHHTIQVETESEKHACGLGIHNLD